MKKMFVVAFLMFDLVLFGGAAAAYMMGITPRDTSTVQGRLVGHWHADGVKGKYASEELFLSKPDAQGRGSVISVSEGKTVRGTYHIEQKDEGKSEAIVAIDGVGDTPVGLPGNMGFGLPKKIKLGGLKISIDSGKVNLGKPPKQRTMRVGTDGTKLVVEARLLNRVNLGGKEFTYVNGHITPERFKGDDLGGWLAQLSK